MAVAIGAVVFGLWLRSGAFGGPSNGGVAVRPAVLLESPGSTHGQRRAAAETGALAPDFEASDLEGNRFRLSDYRGRLVLLNFWATWCTACKAEMPAMQAVQDMHGEQVVKVVAVNMGDDPGRARAYLEDLGVDFDVAMDPDLTLSRAYRVAGLPVTYFIDADGVIRRIRLGEMTREMAMAFTHEILGSGPTSVESGAPQPAAPAPAPGEPATLRVTRDMDGPGTVLLQSPSLRCAIDFCAGYLLQDLRDTPGVTNATSRVVDERTGAWGLLVTYDPAVLTVDEIVAVYQRSLTEHPDPLYPAPHRVEYARADR